METNFHDGEFILTDKLNYRFGNPQRGDVVVFKAPPDGSSEFIKRIIGLPGDTVAVQNGHITVNGQQITEKYLDSTVITLPGNFATEGKSVKIPDMQYFLMGDNRNHSYDSRGFGLVDRSKITGKAWLIYWPPKNVGIVRREVY